jgi:hypothetical protein
LFFWALLPGGFRPWDPVLYFALSCAKFAIQIDATYLIGWLMDLQYMLIPTVGMHKDTTGTMENNPVKEQWIPAHSTIHLHTSDNITPDFSVGISGIPMKKSETNFSWALVSTLNT